MQNAGDQIRESLPVPFCLFNASESWFIHPLPQRQLGFTDFAFPLKASELADFICVRKPIVNLPEEIHSSPASSIP
jgi:hypothetical protein